MKDTIRRIIGETVRAQNPATRYRSPLVGLARASDPGFAALKEAVGKNHLLPADLLPGARSVAAFYLPFTGELVRANRHDPYIARSWAVAYVETNRLIREICRNVATHYARLGVRVAYEQPTHNFDEQKLVSFWSHKHVARICGLGQFGVHQMLITARGCAGRLGSLVLEAPAQAPDPPAPEYCLVRRGKACHRCVRACPTGALTRDGLDKQTCYRQLLAVKDHHAALGYCDVCGKCATGPCAVRD